MLAQGWGSTLRRPPLSRRVLASGFTRSSAAKDATQQFVKDKSSGQVAPNACLGGSSGFSHFLVRLLQGVNVAPVLRGAQSTFLPSKPLSGNTLIHSLRQDSRNICRSLDRWGSRGSSRPRLPVGSPSSRYGPGLQLARNFSSGGPQLAQLITNAPLALRAGADELREYHKKSSVCAQHPSSSARAPSSKAAHQFSVNAHSKRLTASLKQALVCHDSPAAELSEQSGGPAASDMDLYFPEPQVLCAETGHYSIVTEMVIPVDPDIVMLLDHRFLSDEKLQQPLSLLDQRLCQMCQTTSEAYRLHGLRLKVVWQLLRDLAPASSADHHSFTPNAFFEDDSLLGFLPETLHQVGYKVKIRGRSAERVKELLIDRLGLEHGEWFGQLVRTIHEPSQAGVEEDSSSFSREVDGGQTPGSEVSGSQSSSSLLSPPSSPSSTLGESPDTIDGLMSSDTWTDLDSLPIPPESLVLGRAEIHEPGSLVDDDVFLQDSRFLPRTLLRR
ncbi:unnamed protein product [Jaminaea pallidilutea]